MTVPNVHITTIHSKLGILDWSMGYGTEVLMRKVLTPQSQIGILCIYIYIFALIEKKRTY